jgi:hypothetical protein
MQLISYLRATSFEVGVLLHFGPVPRFDRYIDHPKQRRRCSLPAIPASGASVLGCPMIRFVLIGPIRAERLERNSARCMARGPR